MTSVYTLMSPLMTSIINRIRQLIVSNIEGAENPLCVIDSLPVAVIEFHLVPGASNNGSCYGADYGRVASKKTDDIRL